MGKAVVPLEEPPPPSGEKDGTNEGAMARIRSARRERRMAEIRAQRLGHEQTAAKAATQGQEKEEGKAPSPNPASVAEESRHARLQRLRQQRREKRKETVRAQRKEEAANHGAMASLQQDLELMALEDLRGHALREQKGDVDYNANADIAIALVVEDDKDAADSCHRTCDHWGKREEEEEEEARARAEEVRLCIEDILYWVEAYSLCDAEAEGDCRGYHGDGDYETQKIIAQQETEAVAVVPLSTFKRQTTYQAITGRKKQKDLARVSFGQVVRNDMWEEGLGDDFESTPWKPPSVLIAKREAGNSKFMGGKAPLWETGLDELGQLGSGVSLYFSSTRKLSIYMLIASVLSAPCIWINGANETGMTPSELERAGLARYTLGNQGISNEMCSEGDCEQVIDGDIWEPTSVAYFLTGFHLALCISFAVFALMLHNFFQRAIEESQDTNLKASDYSIAVFNLPPEATHAEILKHFSSRYCLDSPPPCFPPRGTFPKRHVVQLVALGFVFGLLLGRLLSLFLAPLSFPGFSLLVGLLMGMLLGIISRVENVNQKSKRGLKSTTAATTGRSPVSGAEPVKSTRHLAPGSLAMSVAGSWVAEVSIIRGNGEALRSCLRQVSVLRRQKRARAKFKRAKLLGGRKRLNRARVAVRHADRNLMSVQENAAAPTSKDCMGAFVTFEHAASRARCLNDYQYSSWFHPKILKYLQPRALWFNEQTPLQVKPVEQPSAIRWENLNVSWKEKLLRRVIAFTLAFALVGLSCAVISIFRWQRSLLEAKIPSDEICDVEIPALTVGEYYADRTDYPTLLRGSEDLTLTCQEEVEGEGEEVVSLVFEGVTYSSLPPLKTPAGESVSREAFSADDICDGPCWSVSESGAKMCSTLACIVPEWQDTHTCTEFPSSAAWECHCLSDLSSIGGLMNLFAVSASPSSSLQCYNYYVRYAYLVAVKFAVACGIVFVNALLPLVLKRLAKSERHSSVTSEAKSATESLFWALFLNTAVAVVLAGGGELGENGISQEWYITVGGALIVTMILNVFTPHIGPLTKAFIVLPWRRRARSRCILQDDLNELEKGPRFEIEVRLAQTLNTVSVGWIYSGGIPMMLWFSCLALWISRAVDKYLLLRVCSRPPHYDTRVVSVLSKYVTYLALCTLLSTCIFFSSLYSPTIEILIRNREWPPYFRVDQQNVAPFFLCFMIFAIVYLIQYVLPSILWFSGRRRGGDLSPSGGSPSSKRGRQRQRQNSNNLVKPPFSGCFYKQLDRNQEFFYNANGSLARPDLEAGWRLFLDGGGQQALYQLWLKDGACHNAEHKAGDAKATWEIISAESSHSYLIGMNKSYQDALQILHQKKGAPAAAVAEVA